jgi:hypothetical protein
LVVFIFFFKELGMMSGNVNGISTKLELSRKLFSHAGNEGVSGIRFSYVELAWISFFRGP